MAEHVYRRGDKIRLKRDVRTRGGRCFRKGVVMRIASASGCYLLEVSVRYKWHYLQLKKKDKWHFELVQKAKEAENGSDSA